MQHQFNTNRSRFPCRTNFNLMIIAIESHSLQFKYRILLLSYVGLCKRLRCTALRIGSGRRNGNVHVSHVFVCRNINELSTSVLLYLVHVFGWRACVVYVRLCAFGGAFAFAPLRCHTASGFVCQCTFTFACTQERAHRRMSLKTCVCMCSTVLESEWIFCSKPQHIY